MNEISLGWSYKYYSYDLEIITASIFQYFVKSFCFNGLFKCAHHLLSRFQMCPVESLDILENFGPLSIVLVSTCRTAINRVVLMAVILTGARKLPIPVVVRPDQLKVRNPLSNSATYAKIIIIITIFIYFCWAHSIVKSVQCAVQCARVQLL